VASEEFFDVQEIFIKYYANRQIKHLSPTDQLPDSQYIFYPQKSDTIN